MFSAAQKERFKQLMEQHGGSLSPDEVLSLCNQAMSVDLVITSSVVSRKRGKAESPHDVQIVTFSRGAKSYTIDASKVTTILDNAEACRKAIQDAAPTNVSTDDGVETSDSGTETSDSNTESSDGGDEGDSETIPEATESKRRRAKSRK